MVGGFFGVEAGYPISFGPNLNRHPDDLGAALVAMGQARPDALFVFAMPADQLNRIVEIAARNRLSAVYGFREPVDAGGLMFFGPKLPDLWRGAANYVDKILKGAKPGDSPWNSPTLSNWSSI